MMITRWGRHRSRWRNQDVKGTTRNSGGEPARGLFLLLDVSEGLWGFFWIQRWRGSDKEIRSIPNNKVRKVSVVNHFFGPIYPPT
jgi:hypothetical protein